MDKDAGIPYSCPAQHRHSHHNDDAGWPNSNLGILQQCQAQIRGLHPLPPPKWQAEEAGTRRFPVVDGEDEADGGGG
jgi:hypothetical protein